jgi:hypothetical protein
MVKHSAEPSSAETGAKPSNSPPVMVRNPPGTRVPWLAEKHRLLLPSMMIHVLAREPLAAHAWTEYETPPQFHTGKLGTYSRGCSLSPFSGNNTATEIWYPQTPSGPETTRAPMCWRVEFGAGSEAPLYQSIMTACSLANIAAEGV